MANLHCVSFASHYLAWGKHPDQRHTGEKLATDQPIR
jgi:hypothetical protein